MRASLSGRVGSVAVHVSVACWVVIACAGTSAAGEIRGDVKAWILANNPGLKSNFLKTELPQKPIKLPNGKTVPLFKIRQFHGANFQLTFHARKKEGVKTVTTMAKRLRKLMARPEFYHWIKRHRSQYKIHGKKVSSQQAYNHFRNIRRRLGVTAGKRYRAPVGGGSGIAAPSWAVWRQMNIFFHEACHCIGIGHNSGGLSGPLAGQLRRWDRKKLWNYQTIDLNTLRAPAPAGSTGIRTTLGGSTAAAPRKVAPIDSASVRSKLAVPVPEAAPPGVAPVGPVATTSIQANWTANGNPAGTEYLVECWEGPDFTGTKVGDSGWTAGLRFDFTELTPDSQYSFRVRARNRGGVETVWVALTSGGASTQAPFQAPSP